MPIGFAVPDAPLRAECAPFSSGIAAGHVPRFSMLTGSVAAHILVITLLAVAYPRVMAWFYYDYDANDLWRDRAEPLRLHLVEPLLFRADRTEKAPAPRGTPGRVKAHEVRAEGAAVAPRGLPVPRNVELPPPVVAAQRGPVILQPDFVPQALPPEALPPLAFWARQGTDTPKTPPATQFVVPGRTEEPSPAPRLATPPVLAVPNREPAAAEVNVSLPQMQAPAPPLPLPNSATMPIRLRNETESRTGSFDVSSGQAANVLVMAAERNDSRDVEIPRGLQRTPSLIGRDGTAVAGSESPRTAGAGMTGSGTQVSAASPGTGARGGSNKTSSDSPTAGSVAAEQVNTATDFTPAGAETVGAVSKAREPRSGDPGAATGNPSARLLSRPEVMQIEHPVNGSFDTVLVQSSALDGLPDVGVALRGSPVYAVYLPVGDQKEWLLEYCLPTGEISRSGTNQVSIGGGAPITPPYPVSTTIPRSILGRTITSHLAFRGLLSANGTLQDLKAPTAESPLTALILELLGEWRFRPALRNNKAIDVEVLLVIPARI